MLAGTRVLFGDVFKMLHLVVRHKRTTTGNQHPIVAQYTARANMSYTDNGIASVLGTLSLFPIDLAKTRLQTQQLFPYASFTYRSMSDCLRKCYHIEGGLLACYRGAPINLLLVGPEKTLKFSIYERVLNLMMRPRGEHWRLFAESLAGGVAGAAQVLITTPMELLKIHQQDMGRIDAHMRARGRSDMENVLLRKRSTGAVAVHVLRQEGVRGLYRGLLPTLLRDVGFSMVYFPLYRQLRERLQQEEMQRQIKPNNVRSCFVSALLAAASAALLVTPLDVIKSRLQVPKVRLVDEQRYAGFVDCYRRVMLVEGPLAFLRGAFCRMLIIGPLFALMQAAHEVEPFRSLLRSQCIEPAQGKCKVTKVEATKWHWPYGTRDETGSSSTHRWSE